jgi:two-component system, OmpR family, sensor histidine kinase CpxA
VRIRLWTRIGITLALNLVLLTLLVAGFLLQQSQEGMEAVWFTAARERIRSIGRLVEVEFPGKSEAERARLLAGLEAQYHVRFAVYDDTGKIIAGPDLRAPENVILEIRRVPAEWPAPTPPGSIPEYRPPARPEDRAMFLIKDADHSRYWVGVNTPIVIQKGNPPLRHVLVVITPSLLASPLFVDWSPWAFGLSLALLVTVACWIPLVRRMTRSIDMIRLAAVQIAEGHFDVSVPAEGGDEIAELGRLIGRMASQLSRLVNGQRRFLADVAHELCAPLSRIELSAGILEQRASADNVEQVRRLERDVAHMTALVGDLLSFTKGATRVPELKPVPLAELVAEVVEQEAAGFGNLTAYIDPSINVLADAEYLRRAVGNVVRNAIRYAGHAGPIQILAERYVSLDSGPLVRLSIEDSGPGLPEEELEAVFAPFYRPDTSRTPGTGGVGLGLAIVKGSVEACGGRVLCSNRQPAGLAVEIHLKEA